MKNKTANPFGMSDAEFWRIRREERQAKDDKSKIGVLGKSKGDYMNAKQKVEHTPGPWKVKRLHDKDYSTTIGDILLIKQAGYGQRTLAEVQDLGVSDRTEANARLIAAAPELVKHLGVLVHRYDGISEAELALTYEDPNFAKSLREARELLANIAKAEGRK